VGQKVGQNQWKRSILGVSFFVFMGKKTGAFHNAPANLINQMRKESIQGNKYIKRLIILTMVRRFI